MNRVGRNYLLGVLRLITMTRPIPERAQRFFRPLAHRPTLTAYQAAGDPATLDFVHQDTREVTTLPEVHRGLRASPQGSFSSQMAGPPGVR